MPNKPVEPATPIRALSAARAGLAKDQIEEGLAFAPKFDADGLIVCITREVASGTILMVAYMNAQALQLSLDTGVAHYWSRSRQALWRKGDTSGQVQKILAIATDCDQDAILLDVEAGGDGNACHTGRKSCFYRQVVKAGDQYLLRFDNAG